MAGIELKSPPEIALMREAGRIVARALRVVAEMAAPGVTTQELDRAAERCILDAGAAPAFKGYRGFPASICASVNEEVVHGIPGPRKLREGDLLKADVGAVWQGYYGDAAVTIPIGKVDRAARRLIDVTRQALQAGISAVRPGVRVAEISAAVQDVVTKAGFSVVRDYTGHGIGRALHEEPRVPNYVDRTWLNSSPVLPQGAVVAIEPMVNAGTHRIKVLPNGWTVVTRDGSLSAHFEHTVAVDTGGAVILTLE